MNTDDLIDAFVVKVNSSNREPGFEDNIPPSVRVGAANDIGTIDWNIKPYPRITWVEKLEQKISKPLPRSYKSLISRCIFPCFEVGPVSFLGNTPEGLVFKLDELRTGIFEDKISSGFLLRNSYIQFAHPSGGGYDPICFDADRTAKKNECPIVQVDHEGILIKSRIIIVERIAPSFEEFINNYLKVV
jgi:hypothetical protein